MSDPESKTTAKRVIKRVIIHGEARLAAIIDKWTEDEIAAGNLVPDFWDEMSTTERLAAHLWAAGYRRV